MPTTVEVATAATRMSTRKKFKGYRVVVSDEVFCRYPARMTPDEVIEAELDVVFCYEEAGHDPLTVAHLAITRNHRLIAVLAPNPDWSWNVTRYDTTTGHPQVKRYERPTPGE